MAILKVNYAFREKAIAEYCGLTHNDSVHGYDAVDVLDHNFEIKTTTTDTFGMARSITKQTIQKWRACYWLMAKGKVVKENYHISSLWLATPSDLSRYLDDLDNRLTIAENIASYFMSFECPPAFSGELSGFISRGCTLNQQLLPTNHLINCKMIDLGDSSHATKQVCTFVKENQIVSKQNPYPNSLALEFFDFN
jgi:hypothetical protein